MFLLLLVFFYLRLFPCCLTFSAYVKLDETDDYSCLEQMPLCIRASIEVYMYPMALAEELDQK